MPNRRAVDEGPDDTEGNRIKFIRDTAIDAGQPETDETDDTEGNRIKFIRETGIDAGQPERDDTEGNAFRH